MELVIRKINIDHLSQLQKISKITFAETFTEHNTKEDLDKYLVESFSNEKKKIKNFLISYFV
jgi:hypothetical protein